MNVGWLDPKHEFRTGQPSEELLAILWNYCKVCVAEARGIHHCEFCPGRYIYYADRDGEFLSLGASEIRVFGRDSAIYAAPSLIYHYVSHHHYEPPAEFVEALLEGPAAPDQAYFERLKELHLQWRWLEVTPAKPVLYRYGPTGNVPIDD